ncbi:MAG TPA: hypothetical protein GX509_07765 [Firmicutes bacterium]|nr:hypothetical protein [Bacillota bacterium]HHY98619.1 hypothetical protein [Bacillota bacterium]
MHSTTCPDCKRQVSSWELFCPYCGGETKRKAIAAVRAESARKEARSSSVTTRLLNMLKSI